MIDMIMYGNAPTLISGVPKVAPSLAITRSQERARPIPPASTWPLAAQRDGLPSRGISRKNSRKRSEAKCLATNGASAAKPPRSAPAQKTFSPAPERTTARTSSEALASFIASTSSLSIWPESMLRFSGSFSVTVATPSATSKATFSPLHELSPRLMAGTIAVEEVGSATVHFAPRERPEERDSGDRNQRLQRHQARPRSRAQALHLQPGARRPARVDGVVGEKGALAPPQRVGGHLLGDLGDGTSGRARLPRPLLSGGVRRPGR